MSIEIRCPRCHLMVGLLPSAALEEHLGVDKLPCVGTAPLLQSVEPTLKPEIPIRAAPEPKVASKNERATKESARKKRQARTEQLIAEILTQTPSQQRAARRNRRFVESESYKTRQAAAAAALAERDAAAAARKAGEEERRLAHFEKPPKPEDPKKRRIKVVRGGLPGLGKRQ